MTLPNALSSARIGLGVLAALGWLDAMRGGAGLAVTLAAFAAGVLTDVLDGPIARRTGSTTTVGAILDPLADKALVFGVLWPLALTPAYALALGVLLARDAAVTLLRARWPARYRPSVIAKAKTALLYCACAVVLVHAATDALDWRLAEALLLAGIAASLASVLGYVRSPAVAHA